MSFDCVNIDLKKKPTWFVEKTYGTVSVVKYKGEYIMESLVNSDFVDEVWKKLKILLEFIGLPFLSLSHLPLSIRETQCKKLLEDF